MLILFGNTILDLKTEEHWSRQMSACRCSSIDAIDLRSEFSLQLSHEFVIIKRQDFRLAPEGSIILVFT